MFRICSEFSAIFSSVQNFQQFSEFSVMFRICSEFLVIFRIFRLFSEYLAQKLVCSESLDFVVFVTPKCWFPGPTDIDVSCVCYNKTTTYYTYTSFP
jgi:hypothetical protein